MRQDCRKSEMQRGTRVFGFAVLRAELGGVPWRSGFLPRADPLEAAHRSAYGRLGCLRRYMRAHHSGRNMCFGLILQIALVRVGTVIILERPLDIHRMCIVTFNQVGIVAIHGAHQRGERREQARRKATTKICGLLREVKCKIGERRAVA